MEDISMYDSNVAQNFLKVVEEFYPAVKTLVNEMVLAGNCNCYDDYDNSVHCLRCYNILLKEKYENEVTDPVHKAFHEMIAACEGFFEAVCDANEEN